MGKMILVVTLVVTGCWAGARSIQSVDTVQSTRVSSIDARIAREVGK
jgi:hypothetical protein